MARLYYLKTGSGEYSPLRHKNIIFLLFTGIIVYTCTVDAVTVSNIFLILIYIYLLVLLKSKNTITDSEVYDDYEELFCIETLEDRNEIIRKISKEIGIENQKLSSYKAPLFWKNKHSNKIAIFIKEMNNQQETENNRDIIATLTHDLKTPAVAQIRAIELLLKGNFGEITDTQRSFLNEILNSCHNMLDMLMNMLWLYKFDNSKVAVNTSSFDVNEIIKDVFTENKLMLDENQNVFEQNNRTAKIHIVADKLHIKRVIFNLLINAVTHSKKGSTIFIETKIESNNFIFKVINEGEYLSDDILKCIFDKKKVFTQKRNGLSTGLGLYLSNSLLKLNGGKIIYNSTPEGINTFGFRLELSQNKITVDDNSVSLIK